MTDNPRPGWQISAQVIVGLLIVAFGLLLTGSNIGLVPNVGRIIQFWPMVIVAGGLATLLERESSGSRRFFGGFMVFIGLWWTGNTAFHLGFYIDDWWPLILVGLGVFLVWRAAQREPDRPPQGGVDYGGGLPDGVSGIGGGPGAMGGTVAGAAPVDHRDDVVTAVAFMSGVKRNIVSSTFRRANVTAIMGGVELDLRQSTASGGQSVVDVFAMWGGIVIRVPADWAVVSKVTPIMGGVDDSSAQVQPIRHRLVVQGTVLMGGVEVKS